MTQEDGREEYFSSNISQHWREAFSPGREENHYRKSFFTETEKLLCTIRGIKDRKSARIAARTYISTLKKNCLNSATLSFNYKTRTRDSAMALRSLIRGHSERLAGFSVIQALMDLANGIDRKDLKEGFFAEMTQMIQGLEGRAPTRPLSDFRLEEHLSRQEASRKRSDQLDHLFEYAESNMRRYRHGLEKDVVKIRRARRKCIQATLGASEEDWFDWHWQVRNVVKDPDLLAQLIPVDDDTLKAIRHAREINLPFGVTPLYLSMMDEDPYGGYDTALRAQVFPPAHYVESMEEHRKDQGYAFDFMGEHDTSPQDLITRRYVSIVILKPYNTCPQICVYCQRNWEIDDTMAPDALAGANKIEAALDWIAERPAITDVLLTGGDPMVMGDQKIAAILERLAANPNIERIRIGTRTLVTLPMRFTDELVEMLGSYREPGRREIEIITHVQHPYEVNPQMVRAVDSLRRQGISLYNQLVYTFYASRRFEASALRKLLKRVGIDPYYTFNTKGKDETANYRVPIARLLQEQKEEARLLPGTVRCDEAVYNLPKLGKSYLRESQSRDLLAILPDGARVYRFHPWEKNIVDQKPLIAQDIPILSYLDRLSAIGEDPDDYDSIWYYY